jgi:hypothetical protein
MRWSGERVRFFEKPLFAALNPWVRLQNKKMLCIGHVIYLLC